MICPECGDLISLDGRAKIVQAVCQCHPVSQHNERRGSREEVLSALNEEHQASINHAKQLMRKHAFVEVMQGCGWTSTGDPTDNITTRGIILQCSDAIFNLQLMSAKNEVLATIQITHALSVRAASPVGAEVELYAAYLETLEGDQIVGMRAIMDGVGGVILRQAKEQYVILLDNLHRKVLSRHEFQLRCELPTSVVTESES